MRTGGEGGGQFRFVLSNTRAERMNVSLPLNIATQAV